jgi:hypothetical protein
MAGLWKTLFRVRAGYTRILGFRQSSYTLWQVPAVKDMGSCHYIN